MLLSVADLASELAAADCVVVATDHSSYDWEEVLEHSRLIFDTRNVLASFASIEGKVHKL